jgi:kynurenine 3-monooxygenase
MNTNQTITIIGAGLCGSLLGLRLAERGFKVSIFEKRSDPRLQLGSRGRSINLALSDRGLRALRLVGVAEAAQQIAIPMIGRAIHGVGELLPTFVNYSGRQDEHINSISRRDLNLLLLEKLQAHSNASVFFEHECKLVDEDARTISFLHKGAYYVHAYGVAIGTDGANSAIRDRFLDQANKNRFDYSVKFLEAGYKELEIPAGADGAYLLSKNHLHIWPRKGYMMIALPNMDGSFTVTMFMPFEGDSSFGAIESDQEIVSFFEQNFPTARQLMPDLVADYRANPTSSLSTIKCHPWVLNSNLLLMGDAAHAIVPFYGQGMNASFEDVLVLDSILDKCDEDWKKTLDMYNFERKIDTDAIADLASDNFYEMRDGTADPVFLKKRKLELMLEQKYPDYFSKYSLVTFREDVPYNLAMRRGRAQDNLLMEIAAMTDLEKPVDLLQIKNRIDLIQF